MFWRKKPAPLPEMPERPGVFSTDMTGLSDRKLNPVAMQKLVALRDGAMDDNRLSADALMSEGVPEAQFLWYASQGFIGYQACAVIAQNWLVDKACRMPARDAIRQGYEIHCDDHTVIKRLQALDKQYGINSQMRQFIHFGRIYGIRVAIFKVDSSDPYYYEKPFNLDGVRPNSYRGISQVDPIWCTPILTGTSLDDPSSSRFYDPEFYQINGRKYHRSHLAVYIPHPVVDVLKPMYQYGGVPLPQMIAERVYAAERTANEGPQLAMTKRTSILKVNASAFFANIEKARTQLLEWVGLRDNFGIKVVDKESEDYAQHDTGLADLDATIMTQYQLVAAVAGVPATKLLGTQPKGFNSTGDYEDSCYREELESIQTNDLTPMLQRHHDLLVRSNLKMDIETTISWMPLDSPTAAEYTDINLKKAQTAQIYADIGAIDGMDIRDQIKADKNSDFYSLADFQDDI